MENETSPSSLRSVVIQEAGEIQDDAWVKWDCEDFYEKEESEESPYFYTQDGTEQESTTGDGDEQLPTAGDGDEQLLTAYDGDEHMPTTSEGTGGNRKKSSKNSRRRRVYLKRQRLKWSAKCLYDKCRELFEFKLRTLQDAKMLHIQGFRKWEKEQRKRLFDFEHDRTKLVDRHEMEMKHLEGDMRSFDRLIEERKRRRHERRRNDRPWGQRKRYFDWQPPLSRKVAEDEEEREYEERGEVEGVIKEWENAERNLIYRMRDKEENHQKYLKHVTNVGKEILTQFETKKDMHEDTLKRLDETISNTEYDMKHVLQRHKEVIPFEY